MNVIKDVIGKLFHCHSGKQSKCPVVNFFIDIHIQRSKIDEILNRLNNIEGNILRAKGIISTESEKWIQFDYVPGEVIIRDTTPDCIGRICVIGEHINEDVLSLLFEL